MGTSSGLLADLPTLITNASLLVVFGGAITAGVVKGIKEWREFSKPAASNDPAKSQIAAVTILENITLSEWTASNKAVVVAIVRLCDMLDKHHDEMADTRRVIEDVRHEMRRGK